MNIPEKTRLFLPLLSLLWVCSVVPVYGQNWQEYYALNQGNYLSWQRTVLSNPYVIQYPDPAVGTLDVTRVGSLLTITFTPAIGAEGVAEFILEYLQGPIPPSLKVEAFRIFVSTSFVEANKDFVSVQENSPDNALYVLDNDTSHGSVDITVSHIAAVKNGTADISADGRSVLFTPVPDFVGMSYLIYVACDELGSCDKAEVSICVTPDGPPALLDTVYLSTHSRASVVAVLPMDDFVVSEAPGHGLLLNLSPNSWQYTPHQTFDGTDEFVLTKDDFTRHVIVDVFYKAAPNTFVNADRIFTRVDEPVTFDVLANDVKKYPVDAFTEPDKGLLSHDTVGVFTYIPEAGYHGAQTFTYTTCFLTQCETGLVIVYVGDMIPQNIETYHLVTPQDVPLILNYEIPLDGYAFSINALPSEGTLALHSGLQNIQVLCSAIEGYDLMAYTPPVGFTGNDYFEIVYCIDGGECHLVKIDVEVMEAPTMQCPCVDHCVWPGDADANGQVNLADFLSIGWQIGFAGPARTYPDNNAWMGQTASNWESSMWELNSKYADSDGSGVITSQDVNAVYDYYLRKHTLVPEITGLKADYTFDIIPLTPEVDSGDLAVFEISIGTESSPVLDMHGVAFSLNLPMDKIDTSTIEMYFYDDSWLGHDAPSIQLIKQSNSGIDAAYTRTSGKPASGIGIIGIMTFIVTDDINGVRTPDGRVPLKIGVNSVSSMASSGLTYDVIGNAATVYLTAATQDDSSPEDHVFVYPNPSSGDLLNVHANGDRALRQVELYDLSGSLIASWHDLTEKHFSPDVSKLQTGLYVLRITTTDGVVSRKVEIVK